jgi:2-methylisocitrate lyase-like PEP mutase family enzyme
MDQASLLDRVRTARAARQHILVTARCPVPPGRRYQAALGWADALLAAGADAIVVQAAPAELRRFALDLACATLICAGSPALDRAPMAAAAQLQQWGYSALSSQYHRCYCVRRRCAGGPGPPALALAELDRAARPGPPRPARCDDLERKQ